MNEVTAPPTIPSYSGTVFISYARADDEKPPLDDTTHGWVTFFWLQLRWELNNLGVHQAGLWLDRFEIEPAENFTEKIEAALKAATFIIPILSPNWVTRPYCQQELSRFLELRPQPLDTAADPIVLVKKSDPPEADIPEPLRNREGYKFFAKDPSGRPREFYWRGLQDQAAYFARLHELATWISERLLTIPRVPKAARSLFGRTIYVAAPADELRDAWRRLVNDLIGAGNMVVPADGRLSDTAARADAEISAALEQAEMSIHFLGESEGMTPDGGDETIVRRQLRLAREHAATVGNFPRVLWAPKWLPDREDKRRDPFKVVNRFGAVLAGEEIYSEEVTDLSQYVRERLAGSAWKPSQATQMLLVAGANGNDDHLVTRLANLWQSADVKIKPVYSGEPLPATDLFAAVLLPWGTAERASVEALLTLLAPLTRRLIVLSLPGGDEVAKRRFFHEGAYLEPLEALPADRRAARDLLIRLDVLQPNQGDQK